MSKLSYRIQQSLDMINGVDKNRTVIMKLYMSINYFIKDLWYDYPHVWINNLKYIFKNLKFFWTHIINMRDWDSSYQLDLFCDSLEYLAKGLKNHGNHVNSMKYYKRCLFATRRLKKAYNAEVYNYKSYQKLVYCNPAYFTKEEAGLCRLVHNYGPRGEEYYTKMFKLINNKYTKIIEKEKKDAWIYLHKYFESYWD